MNHYSVRTEEAYVGWIRRYILYHNKKHPREMGALEVELYLTHLAVGEKASTNTQKQALNALVFLYHRVLQKPLGRFRDIERPKRPQRRPLVLGKDEVERILQVMGGIHQLIATLLLYGNASARVSASASSPHEISSNAQTLCLCVAFVSGPAVLCGTYQRFSLTAAIA